MPPGPERRAAYLAVPEEFRAWVRYHVTEYLPRLKEFAAVARARKVKLSARDKSLSRCREVLV